MAEFEDYDDEEEEVVEPFSIEEMAEILREEADLEVEIRASKGVPTLFVLSEDPAETREYIRNEVAPDLDMEAFIPRKTKKGGFQV